MKILITGTAGFIGFHLANRLLAEGHVIIGVDNINDYYDVQLKKDRLEYAGIKTGSINDHEPQVSETNERYKFIKADLTNSELIHEIFKTEKPNAVVNLAAQAGVRYSLEHPQTYVDSNITGFLNILEGCRHYGVEHLIYASSSSVYGANTNLPFSTEDRVDNPVSLYAASKKSNELMAHTYSHLFDIPTTGLRFFTVYGPWGRPDMALFIFTKAIIEGKKIDVYNFGKMSRDFTYVDDIVEGIARLIPKAPVKSESKSVPYRLLNIGYGSPVKLMDFIHEIEQNLDIEADKNLMPIQPGDVPKTWADVDSLFELTNFKPQVSVKEGVKNFINWYKEYKNIE